MRTILRKADWSYLLFTLLVLASRMPFLAHGFGLHENSWGVALSARTFHDSGTYEASRFPGFPLHEMLCSLTVNHGYFLTNLVVALVSTAGILFFVFTLKALRFRYPLLGGAVLAAVPVMFISSVITYDYSLALAFLLASLFFTLQKQPVAAGVLLGLATGFRITSAAMLLPYAILVTKGDGMRENSLRILKLVAATVVLAVFAFLPVISQYGFSFFTYESVPYPDIDIILFRFFDETWGTLGVAALLFGTVVMVLPHGKAERKFLFPRSVNEKHVVAWLIAIDLYIIAFLKLPSESGYLLPLVPFVILVFCKYLHSKAFIVFSVLIFLSPVMISIAPATAEDGQDILLPGPVMDIAGRSYDTGFKGPVLLYDDMRKRSMARMDALFNDMNAIPDISLVITGKWYNQIQFSKNSLLHNRNIILVDYINQPSLARYFENGYDVYYIPGEDKNNAKKYHFELGDEIDAEPLTFQ